MVMNWSRLDKQQMVNGLGFVYLTNVCYNSALHLRLTAVAKWQPVVLMTNCKYNPQKALVLRGNLSVKNRREFGKQKFNFFLFFKP